MNCFGGGLMSKYASSLYKHSFVLRNLFDEWYFCKFSVCCM